jgi:hypothetical protein
MINEEKKRVFEYLGWKICLEEKDRLVKYCSYVDTCYSCPIYHPLDGNDLILAINKMVENNEWITFYLYAEDIYFKETLSGFNFFEEAHAAYSVWLINPPRFFQLMSEAIEKGAIK